VRHLLKLLLLTLPLLFSSSVQASILRVPAVFATIGEALSNATPHDTVLLAAGLYTGDGQSGFDIDSLIITIMSESGPDSTIVDLAGGVFMEEKPDAFYYGHDVTLRGITFRHGRLAIRSLTSFWLDTQLNVINCVFDHNQVGLRLAPYTGHQIDSCWFTNNDRAIYTVDEVFANIINCRFEDNWCGIYSELCPWYLVAGNIFARNDVGTWIDCMGGATIIGNVWMGNQTGFVANEMLLGWLDAFSCNAMWHNGSNFYGPFPDLIDTNGNFAATPRLCDTTQFRFAQVSPTSPLLPSNNACSRLIGNVSVGCDCCFGTTGNFDYDSADLADISDLSYVVDYLFFSGAAPICTQEADLNTDSILDISDLSLFVDFLFFGGQLPACP
jgi:hypothetical protein